MIFITREKALQIQADQVRFYSPGRPWLAELVARFETLIGRFERGEFA